MEVKPIFDGAINQQHNNETWIAAVNVTSNSSDNIQTETLYGEGNKKYSISKDCRVQYLLVIIDHFIR